MRVKSMASLVPLLAALPALAAAVRGVDPAFASAYAPADTFTCLDGSATIPFQAVNDDYCDCADGSDEPGTSACEGRERAWFWCENRGHVPGRVRAGRVNDGICDFECCDGSDEWETGACADRCAQVGIEYRERVEAEAKVRKTGSKIRSTYIKHAQKERERLEAELVRKRDEVAAKEKEVEAAKRDLDRAEARSKEDLERKKQSPLFKSLQTHRSALARLHERSARLQGELATVLGILDELSKGYNPNYQDMAVKAAVVGFQELMGLTDANGEGGDVKPDVVEHGQPEIEDREIDEVLGVDLDNLLLTAEDEVEEKESLLYKIDEYIPDSLYEYYDAARDAAIDLLIRIRWIGKAQVTSRDEDDLPHVAAARERHQALTKDVNKLNRDIKTAEGTLDRMRDGYGPQGEWKKLDGTCIDTVAGDYTYEVCFFGKATQKSNKDGATNNLGSYVGWNDSADVGTFEYYSKQNYKNGGKCWNGPMRSVALDLSCGTTNALLSVAEPEKCEYRFKATTPALCWPLDAPAVGQAPDEVKDEL
ncbi:hypothetical protein Q5752_000467 [Cryptotrichosporon argae]